MKLDDILITEEVERGEQVVFNFKNSNFDMTGDMVFDVSDVILMDQNDYTEIEDVGKIKLNVTPEKFAQTLVDSSGQQVVEILDVELDGGVKNFRCTSNCTKTVPNLPANYDLKVTFTTSGGDTKQTTLTFNGIAFKPSDEFVSKYLDLTQDAYRDNMGDS